MKSTAKEVLSRIVERLSDGAPEPGTKLPTEMELAKELGLGRMAVHGAMRRLEDRGFVKRNKGAGTALLKTLSHKDMSMLLEEAWRTVYVVASPEKNRQATFHWNATILLEMESEFRRNKWRMITRALPLNPNRKDLEALLRNAEDDEAETLLLIPDYGELDLYRTHASLLRSSGHKVCVFNRGLCPAEDLPFSSVCLDPCGEGALAAAWLRQHGHGAIKVVTIRGIDSVYWISERVKGIVKDDNAAPAPEVWAYSDDTGAAKIAKRVSASRTHCALVAVNDAVAALIIDAAAAFGLRAPHDFSIISFDNNPAYLPYNLTTVAPPVGRVGKLMPALACSSLFPVEPDDIVRIHLASSVIERGTCARHDKGEHAAPPRLK